MLWKLEGYNMTKIIDFPIKPQNWNRIVLETIKAGKLTIPNGELKQILTESEQKIKEQINWTKS